jgi:autophagy-related protein 9
MSIPFATRYVDQFPKRMTEDIARTVAFMAGALTAVLALLTLLDSELFLAFEITKDRTVLFYLGVFGAIWAVTRGMVSEETQVFDPEFAMRSVVHYTRYMPAHWEERLHSFEVKKEFSELFKMKVIIVLEEIFGIVTSPLLLLISLPRCTDQIVDFFREFTVHVDGLGYVCSFAVFDFKKGMGDGPSKSTHRDVREDYYSTKHGKMAASYYGFIDNYVWNPKTGIPGHMPQTSRNQFHPPPTFPGLQSSAIAADMQGSTTMRADFGRLRSRGPGAGPSRAAPPAPSPMASMLLDPHHQPTGGINPGGRRHTHAWIQHHGADRITEEGADDMSQSQSQRFGDDDRYDEEETGALGESAWQTSPGRGLSRDYSAANTEEPETGVLGLIGQLTQAQRNRRGGGVV